MKKLAIIAALAVTIAAQAGEVEELKSKLCAAEADTAVLVVQAANQNGTPWETMEKMFAESGLTDVKNLRKAYYSYRTFDKTTIQTLIFNQCQIDFLRK